MKLKRLGALLLTMAMCFLTRKPLENWTAFAAGQTIDKRAMEE